jgi:uncharacterized protein (TIGR03435 family)
MKLCFLSLACLTALLAQTFEVASIKPPVPGLGRGDSRGGPGTDDPGRISWPRVNLSFLLMKAYDVEADQISGPAWIDDPSYSWAIDATMPPTTTKDQFRAMLQNLLAARFHLKLHHEARAHPGYELHAAPGGSKLKPWVPSAAAAPFKPGMDANGFPKFPPGASGGEIDSFGAGAFGPAAYRTAFRESVADFCLRLGSRISQSNGAPRGSPRPRVADKTGLAGIYEFTLAYAPAGAPAGDAAAVPDIFTALQEQLGLKLVKVKDVPVDVLIVDSADKVPTAN